MLGFECKVLMVEHVDLLLLQNGTVIFTRPVLVIIVDVELLFKSQKNKQTHKNIQADITLLQITYAREARSDFSYSLFITFKK